MADFVTIEITGLAEIRRDFQSLANLTPENLGIVKAMSTEAETMMGISKREYVPVDLGTLRSSGQVNPPKMTADEAEVTLGYGGAARAYAFKVHENPRAGKTGGFAPAASFQTPFATSIRIRRYKHWAKVGQWKFLETPVALRQQAYFDAVAAAAHKAIQARFGG